jgi:hypothetical protein
MLVFWVIFFVVRQYLRQKHAEHDAELTAVNSPEASGQPTDADAKRAQSDLITAERTTSNTPHTSYKTVRDPRTGMTIKLKQQMKTNADGIVVYCLSTTIPASPNLETITLGGPSGNWTIYPHQHVAIKMEFTDDTTSLMAAKINELLSPEKVKKLADDDCTYEERSLTIAGKPTIIVTRKLGEKTQKEIKSTLSQTMKTVFPNSRLSFDQLNIASMSYYIDSDTNLIYGTETNSADGSLLSSNLMNRVEITPDLPDSLFRVPQDFETYTPKTVADYSSILMKIFGARN